MKKRKLFISDIHGCYNAFTKLLQNIKYDPYQDELFLLGDYVDRGTQSKKVIEMVMELNQEYNVITLLGNHDDMLLNSFKNNGDDINWINNGGFLTIESYVGYDWFTNGFDWEEYEKAKKFIVKNYSHHLNFLRKLPYYHELDEYILVHAGINPLLSNWKNTSLEDFIWIRELFYKNKNTNTHKTIIFGHTPTLYLQNSEDVWFSPYKDKIGIDGACAYGNQLNCLEIGEMGYRQYSVNKMGNNFEILDF